MFPVHTIDHVGGDPLAQSDRVQRFAKAAVANLAGGGNGTAVTTAVAIAGLPTSYNVQVTPSQACFASVSAKTIAGFNVVLTPKDGSTTLSAGTFDVVVTY